ncbi:conjugal transfer protein TrbL family protein [Kitasatospora phosalacinea]|uniref:TrbL n=1 Tax=Kitasatospora phosalacinea TaxID=2065 RepID=A0A9W6PDM3_9ACTN|nr:conjugal transfer protein TrbL family protein [Kitasatospora phosalacinea]GLW53033.1 hypothetical protein Kpho01_10440 [Kitasatospora phosalacinea]
MACGLTDPIGCVTDTVLGSVAGDAVSKMASSAWESICQSFADAMVDLLKTFADAFAKMAGPDLASNGVRSVYAISLGISALVACLLVLGQVVRTAVTHDGRPLATAMVGLGKAVLAFMLTLVISSTALVAADELTQYIVDNTLGGQQQFADKVAKLVAWNPGNSASLLLILAILGILLTIVLWFEMLLRGAAIAVLVATSPIAAAGQVSDSTKTWWSKLVSMTVQLIILKPIIALVFALGFNLAGDSQDLTTTLSGMLVLLLAALAWPAVARFFTFASVQMGGGAGLAALLGFAGGQLSASGAGGAPVGTSPDTFGQEAASRTMTGFASKGGAAAGGAASGGAGGAGAAAGGAGAAAGPIGLAAVAGVRLAQQAVNSLAGGMEKMAGHAGAQGANIYAAQPAGYVNRHAGAQLPTSGELAGALPDQPKPDWSGQQEAQAESAEPVEPAGYQADHQQARQDATPHLPVTAVPADPPTIEMPPVPAGAAPAAAATAAPTPVPQGGAVPPPASSAASPSGAVQGTPPSAPNNAAPAARPPAQAATSTGSATAPLPASRPVAAAGPAADPAQTPPAAAEAPADRPRPAQPETAPAERPVAPPAKPVPPVRSDQPKGGENS